MVFVVVGVLLIVMKSMAFGPVAEWSWWGVLSPFGLAVAWWGWADWSGHTQRRQMRKMDERKQERRRKSLAALGIEQRRRR